MQTKTITKGNRAVVITTLGPGRIQANLYVNVRNGIEQASITPSRWTGKTVKGAEKWATEKLAA